MSPGLPLNKTAAVPQSVSVVSCVSRFSCACLVFVLRHSQEDKQEKSDKKSKDQSSKKSKDVKDKDKDKAAKDKDKDEDKDKQSVSFDLRVACLLPFWSPACSPSCSPPSWSPSQLLLCSQERRPNPPFLPFLPSVSPFCTRVCEV